MQREPLYVHMRGASVYNDYAFSFDRLILLDL